MGLERMDGSNLFNRPKEVLQTNSWHKGSKKDTFRQFLSTQKSIPHPRPEKKCTAEKCPTIKNRQIARIMFSFFKNLFRSSRPLVWRTRCSKLREQIVHCHLAVHQPDVVFSIEQEANGQNIYCVRNVGKNRDIPHAIARHLPKASLKNTESCRKNFLKAILTKP